MYAADKVKDLGLPMVQSEPNSVRLVSGGYTVATVQEDWK